MSITRYISVMQTDNRVLNSFKGSYYASFVKCVQE